MRGIRKAFAGTPVLHGVDLTLHPGETLALLGGNGAGKSTLMRILSGDYSRDGGNITVDGHPLHARIPAEAEAAGIRVIYQELNYAPDLCVAENIHLGHLPRRSGPLGRFSVDWKTMHQTAEALLSALDANIDTHSPMRDLSVGKQQIVEIARAISGDARILVMDEPTAALTPREVSILFATIRRLREQGVGIIFISHRLDEVEEIADRVMVLRDGRIAGDLPMEGVSRGQIVRMMIGRDLEPVNPTSTRKPGGAALELRALSRKGAFEDVTLTANSGEILGLFGLLGAGQDEVVRAVFGAEPATSGSILLNGTPTQISSPRQARKAGLGFVPQDRKTDGLVHEMSVGNNLLLANFPAVAPAGVFNQKEETEHVHRWVKKLGIVLRSAMRQEVRTLSGGNQQKVMLARWLEAGVSVLLLDEPTRGVDVGARADIYAILEELRQQGLAIMLVSSDMEEVLALCDRVAVFRGGKVVQEFTREQASQERLLSTAAGEVTER